MLFYSPAFESRILQHINGNHQPVGPAPHQPKHGDMVPVRLQIWEDAVEEAVSKGAHVDELPLQLCMDRCFWGGAGALRREAVQRMLEEEAGIFQSTEPTERASYLRRESK